MPGWTNRGKYLALGWAFRGETIPANFYVGLLTAAVAPTKLTNTFGDAGLVEVANGNGYVTGGYQLTPNSTDFPTWTEDDTNFWALLDLKTVSWVASGGSIPVSGAVPRYACLLDNNATIGSRQVLSFWDLGTVAITTIGNTLSLAALELRLTET